MTTTTNMNTIIIRAVFFMKNDAGEDCAVHKSLTAYVASDRKAKASRDNCYTRIPCGTLLQGNEKTLKKYTEKTVAYLLGGPS